MTFRDRPYPAFFGLAVLLFLLATAGSDVVARTTVSGEVVGKAVAEHFYYALVQPIGTAMLLTPFALLGWMSASLAKRRGFDRGLVLFLIGALLLGVMFFSAYQDSQNYMSQKMWTAATLSIGLLPFKSVPLLLVCFAARWLLARNTSEAQT
jgi:hypothetical protein